ncbi:hypothetical protein HID58_055464, partial [Brassica napus]
IHKNIGEKCIVKYSEAETLAKYIRAYQHTLKFVSFSKYLSHPFYQTWKLCDPEAEKLFKYDLSYEHWDVKTDLMLWLFQK